MCVRVCVRVCVFMCLSRRLLITSCMILTSYKWLNKFYHGYMASVVVIVNEHGLGIGIYIYIYIYICRRH